MYFNLICEEMEITGGNVIHIDKNIGNMDEVHKIVCEHIKKISQRQMGALSNDY